MYPRFIEIISTTRHIFMEKVKMKSKETKISRRKCVEDNVLELARLFAKADGLRKKKK
jgi:hypothetical protein